MKDKQIIIDEVDISGCPYYIDSDGSCSSHDCECIKCIHNVCFYKDYKAKEQECEELKKAIDGLLKIQYQLADSCTKYEQTLTKIKDIAKKTLNMVDYKTYFKRDNKSLKQEGFKTLNEILQKISEWEGNNE